MERSLSYLCVRKEGYLSVYRCSGVILPSSSIPTGGCCKASGPRSPLTSHYRSPFDDYLVASASDDAKVCWIRSRQFSYSRNSADLSLEGSRRLLAPYRG